MSFSKTNIEITGKYDVVVCGGGPAGFCAAVQAGRMGGRTALIEKYGMLGGAMTIGGISGPMSFHAFGHQVIAGIGWELMERLADMNWAVMPDPPMMKNKACSQVNVNAFMAAQAMDAMCAEAGVELYFHQPVVEVVSGNVKDRWNGKENSLVEGVVISTKSGLRMLETKVLIDCTGDGDAAAWSGARFEKGDPVTGELQPGTLSFYLTGYKSGEINHEEVDAAYKKARNAGVIKDGDYWGEQFWGGSTILKTQGRNINHVSLDGSDSASRSAAETKGRESVARVSNWVRDCLRSWGEITPILCAPETWVRESRRITGDAYITGNDYIAAREYSDPICHCFYPVDIHRSKTGESKEVILEADFLKSGKVPSIPMGAIIVKGFKNLLVAGRCISGDRVAQSAYRIQATCMATGQAAGVLSALAKDLGGDVRKVKYQEVKAKLMRCGAIVP